MSSINDNELTATLNNMVYNFIAEFKNKQNALDQKDKHQEILAFEAKVKLLGKELSTCNTLSKLESFKEQKLNIAIRDFNQIYGKTKIDPKDNQIIFDRVEKNLGKLRKGFIEKRKEKTSKQSINNK